MPGELLELSQNLIQSKLKKKTIFFITKQIKSSSKSVEKKKQIKFLFWGLPGELPELSQSLIQSKLKKKKKRKNSNK